jgi:hypothetical protein
MAGKMMGEKEMKMSRDQTVGGLTGSLFWMLPAIFSGYFLKIYQK